MLLCPAAVDRAIEDNIGGHDNRAASRACAPLFAQDAIRRIA